jgi:dihydropteroate synthase
MGILNLTPDSFYDGGFYASLGDQLRQVERMLGEGAAIIDLGGVSTRPGARQPGEKEEMDRVLPVLSAVIREFPGIIVSVDTFRASVARASVEQGACIINDVSGGGMDRDMFSTIAELKVPCIIMHMQGTPADMQDHPVYHDVVAEVLEYLAGRLKELERLGINDNVMIDPGFGFGKTLEHNYRLLQNLSVFKSLKRPVLVGLSRKSMVCRLLGTDPAGALNGTTVVNTIALLRGASILRVHDVKPAMEAVKIVTRMQMPP